MFLHSQIHVFGLLEANPTILLLCDLALLCTHPSAAVGFLRVILCPAGWGYTNLTPYPSLMGWKVVVFRKISSLPLYHCNMFTYQDETHTCLTRNQNTCFSLMGGLGRKVGQGSKFDFPSSCPWVYFNISSHYSERRQSDWWGSTKGQNWQRTPGFVRFFG